MRRFIPIAIAATAVGLLGCGGGDSLKGSGDQATAESTIQALTLASRKGDGAKICNELFAKPLKDTIEAASKRSCPEEVKAKLFAPDAGFKIDKVAVSGSTGTVKVTDQLGKTSLVALIKQSGKWKIIGVTPA